MSQPNSTNPSDQCNEPSQQGRRIEQPKELMPAPDHQRAQAQIDFSVRGFEGVKQHYGVEAAERLRQKLADLVRVELEVAASATLLETSMGSGDAPMMTMPPLVHQRSTKTKLQITVLSDNRDLMPRLEYCLRTLGAEVTCVETIDEANGIANAGKSAITIVDLHAADAWPGHVFQLFDERAASDPVVILCSDANDANHYRERSRHAVDIFPDDAVDDHRFQCVIQAALLRAEAVSSDKREHGMAPAA